MKNIKIVVEDEEFKRLLEKKKDTTWHDFLMTLAKEKRK